MRHLSRLRLVSIACLTAVLLTVQTAQPQTAASFPFPFNLNELSMNQNSASLTAQARLPRSITLRVQRRIARKFGIPVARLRVVSATAQTWSNGCLGLGEPGELCTMALVQGWKVTVTDGSQTWVYRTDSTGRSLRQESQTESNALPQIVNDRVLAAASQESGISIAQLRIMQAEEKTWDGCLGIETGVAMCPQIAIFGWRVVVAGNGRSWVYHTSGDGSEIRLNRFATASLEGVQFLSMLITPLADQVLFRSIASGGIAGYTYETVLLKSGQVIRSLLRANEETFPPRLHRISKEQVQQFEKLLEKFHSFDRLSYAASQLGSDSIIVTLTSHAGTTQYADGVADLLPPDLLTIIHAWGAIVDNA